MVCWDKKIFFFWTSPWLGQVRKRVVVQFVVPEWGDLAPDVGSWPRPCDAGSPPKLPEVGRWGGELRRFDAAQVSRKNGGLFGFLDFSLKPCLGFLGDVLFSSPPVGRIEDFFS